MGPRLVVFLAAAPLSLPQRSRTSTRTRCLAHKAPMRVVFVTTEVAPWSKVGGLADVMGALPAALASRGHQVMTVSPRYRSMEAQTATGILVPLELPSTSSDQQAIDPVAGISLIRHGGVDHLFVDHPLFDTGQDIYDTRPDAGVTTYQEGDPGTGLDLHYNVLCQTALAAPLMLWTGTGSKLAEEGGSRLLDESREAVQSPSVKKGRRSFSGGVSAGADTGSILQHNSLPRADAAPERRHNDNDEDHGLHEPETLAADADHGQDVAAGNSIVPSLNVAEIVSPASMEEQLRAAARAAPAFAAASRLVFVANDWPAALALLRLKLRIREREPVHPDASADAAALHAALQTALASALGALCIHNLAYQGMLSGLAFARLGLPTAALTLLASGTEWRQLVNVANSEVAPPQSVPGGTTVTNLIRSTSSRLLQAWRGLTKSPVAALGAPGVVGSARPGGLQVCRAAATEAVQAEEVAMEPTSIPSSLSLNLLRGGLLSADGILTVSPGYAAEVVSDSHHGCGLDDILAWRGVAGIMNGVDTDVWDPARDSLLPPNCRYDASRVSRGKAAAKAALQARLGLDLNPHAAVFAFIGRLTQQKGVDVILAAVPELLTNAQRGAAAIQLVMLGTGDVWMETALAGLEQSYPGQAAGYPAFSEELAHWMLAGSDYVLLPSRFEPCGLVVPCAMRYGTLPIAASTGGLADMVDAQVGFRLPKLGSESSAVDVRQDAQHLLRVMRDACGIRGTEAHSAMQATCMARDVSWRGPAEEWEAWLQSL